MRLLLVGDIMVVWEAMEAAIAVRKLAWTSESVGSAAAIAAALERKKPDVIVMQARLPEGSAAQVIDEVRRLQEEARVVVIGMDDASEDVFLAALETGARGFVDRTASMDEFLACIQRVAEGQMYIPQRLAARLVQEYRELVPRRGEDLHLSKREMDVLALLAHGHSNKSIAHHLFVSEHTVRAHLRNIMQKLNAENRVQAVARITRDGLLLSLPAPRLRESAEEMRARLA